MYKFVGRFILKIVVLGHHTINKKNALIKTLLGMSILACVWFIVEMNGQTIHRDSTESSNMTSISTESRNRTSPWSWYDNELPNITNPFSWYDTKSLNMANPRSRYDTESSNMTSPRSRYNTESPNMTNPCSRYSIASPNMTNPCSRYITESPNMTNPCLKPKQKNTNLEDILCMRRPVLLPNFKNPCWRSKRKLRCLPYFHIIGVPKSASTDLFKRLAEHPHVVENKGRFGKETWYWSWRRYSHTGNAMKFEAFVDNFKVNAIEDNQIDGYHPFITGQGDPMDFTDFHWNYLLPQNEAGAEELVWTTPYLIKHVNPNVRLILSLRDPVERLYSYYFFQGRGKTSIDFHNHVVNSLSIWLNCTKQHSHRHCLYDRLVRNKMKVSLYSSFYSSHLKEWLKVFPREQFFIFRTEDYKKNLTRTLHQVFDFLNLAPLPPKSMDLITRLPKSRVTKRKANAGPMLLETKMLLVEFYRESTIELAELLGDQRYAFKDVSFT